MCFTPLTLLRVQHSPISNSHSHSHGQARNDNATWISQDCCGAKAIVLTAGADTPWNVAAQLHPGMLGLEDAGRVTIPVMVLACERVLGVRKHVVFWGGGAGAWAVECEGGVGV